MLQVGWRGLTRHSGCVLPHDGHVHTQFSWDASRGDMAATCARAAQIGLTCLAFTEHVDLAPSTKSWDALPEHVRGHLGEGGRFLADPLDVDAYLAEVDRCRSAFPGLRILTGIELGEGHRHPGAVRDLLARAGGFDRIVGSVHTLEDLRGPGYLEAGDGYAQRTPVQVVRDYLAEVALMAASDAPFEVLGHVDYPLRHWPRGAGPVPWEDFEDDARAALAALAASGRTMEVNTRLPMSETFVDWWRDAGGQAVVFGSDAHRPEDLAHAFVETAAMVAEHGFRPGATPYEHWGRA